MAKEFIDHIVQFGRSGLRLLVRDQAFSLTILLSLAIGIGSTGAAFSYFQVLFLRALPGIRGADRVLAIYTQVRGSSLFLPISYPNYRDLRDQSTSFSQIAATQAVQVALTDHGLSERVRGEMVSANYFAALGVEPLRGRFFLPEEDRTPGEGAVLVLAEGLWKRQFGADAGIVGHSVLLNGRPFVVVGIVGSGFHGADLLSRPEIWVPTAMYREVSSTPELFERRGDQTMQVLGRLKPGISARRAATEIQGLGNRLASGFPVDNRDQRIVSLPLSIARLHPNSRLALLRGSAFLMAMGSLLLLVSCSNVASLTLVRTLGRLDELALRSSLGASRGRLWREILAEGLPLAVLALPFGVLLTYLEIWLLWQFRPPFLPADLLIHPFDAQMLTGLVLLSLGSSILLWLTPVLHVRRLDPARAIHGRTHLYMGSDRLFSLRRVIVIAEVGLSFMAISCATYSLIHLRELRHVDPGFDASRLITVAFDLRGLNLEPAAAKHIEEVIRDRVTALPGVKRVAYSSERLLGGSQLMHSIAIPGREDPAVLVGSSLVEPTYFETVGIGVLSGRTFHAHERVGTLPVVIINATMADRLWPGRSAIREHLLLDNEKTPLEVVGVVGDSKLSGIDEAPHPFLYLPITQRDSSRLALNVQVAGDPLLRLETVAREIRAAVPGLPVGVEAVTTALERTLWWPQAMVSLLTLLAALTLFVAGIGIYGITAHTSTRRKSEIGLRLALGARRQSIFRLVIQDGFRTLAIGTVLGGLAAFAVARWEIGSSWTSLPLLASLAGSELLLLVVTLLAELAPALRAVRIEPSAVLKGASASAGSRGSRSTAPMSQRWEGRGRSR